MNELLGGYKLKIQLTEQAINWFKDELDLPDNNKVLQFYVRYGGEFQLKQGFSPAFRVENDKNSSFALSYHFKGLKTIL